MPVTKTTDQYWSELYENGRDFSLITSDALSKILAFTNHYMAKTCLDIGCGTGQLTRELYHRGYTCIGIDAATSAIAIAQSLTTATPKHLKYVHFDIMQNNIRGLPRQPYSLITCKLVYAFIHDKPAFLKKVRQLLIPGGLFVIVTPHLDDVPAERQSIAVGDDELALVGSHFEQVALYRDTNGLTYFVGR